MAENQTNDRGFVVVTGTSTGIGAATVNRLANLGFRIFAGVRREEDAQAARSVANGTVTPLMIDITDAAMIAAAANTVDQVVAERGLAGLVNNAGIVKPGPLEVCCLPYHADAPDHVIAAGVLHDTIEKTDADAADLRTRFGLTIADARARRQRVGYAQRKAGSREQVASAGHEALMVFATDKISKARELGLESEHTRQSPLQPAAVRAEHDHKLAHYHHCLDLLEQLLTDSPLVTQRRTELENAPGISKWPAGTSRRRTSLAQGEIRSDLVTEGLGCSSRTTRAARGDK